MNQTKRKAVITALISTSSILIPASAQEDPDEKIGSLADTTTIARRASQSTSTVTSTVYSVEPDALSAIGITDLSTSLDQLPGVSISSSGQSGAIQGIRVRGLRPQDTQLRVDGVRLTNRNANLSIFVGNGSLNGLSKVELIQGPQAALFGGGSIGGVVGLSTQRGYEGQKNKTRIEAGSFNTLSLEHSKGGRINNLSYFFSSKFQTTDNDTFAESSEANGFDNDSISYTNALRLDYDINSDLSIGFTARISDNSFESPEFGGSTTDSDFYLSTLYADYQVNDRFHTKLTFSYLLENTSFGGGFGFDVDYDQFGISSENTFQYSGQGAFNFGVEYENQDYSNNSAFSPVNRKDHYLAAYLNHAYELENFTFDAGVRFEDYQSFGSQTTWKTGLLYQLNDKKTQFRANLGTAFNTPTLIQLFSPGGSGGNPNLDPETSLGWDIGVTHEFNEKHIASLTFFETEVDEAIAFDFGSFAFQNTPNKSKASGITAGLKGELSKQVDYNLSYTWLDNSFNGQPEQQLDAQVIFNPNDKLQLGLGAKYLDQRSFGGNPLEDAFIVRAFGSYQLTESVNIHARIENLTDTTYNFTDFSSPGFPGASPAARLGAFAGVTIEW